MIERVTTGIEFVRPQSRGAAPYAYAAVTDPGRMVFTAGACPLDSDGATVAVGQARQAMANLVEAPAGAGAELTDVLKPTVFVATTDRRDLVAAWDVVREAFDEHDPPQHAGRRHGARLPRPARRGAGGGRPRQLARTRS